MACPEAARGEKAGLGELFSRLGIARHIIARNQLSAALCRQTNIGHIVLFLTTFSDNSACVILKCLA